MIPVSKVVLSISLLLTLLVALQFNGCESGVYSKTVVEITNKLPNQLWLVLHCKDKTIDLDSQTLRPDQSWSFQFQDDWLFARTLYFCHFVWKGGDRWFDIYVGRRDQDLGHFHQWNITQSGPCRIRWNSGGSTECFPWPNKVVSGGRKLTPGDENNTIGV